MRRRRFRQYAGHGTGWPWGFSSRRDAGSHAASSLTAKSLLAASEPPVYLSRTAALAICRDPDFDSPGSHRLVFMNPEPKNPRISMRDIAKMAGVSHSTISLALKNHPRISEEVKQRVRRLCEEVGYRPD